MRDCTQKMEEKYVSMPSSQTTEPQNDRNPFFKGLDETLKRILIFISILFVLSLITGLTEDQEDKDQKD